MIHSSKPSRLKADLNRTIPRLTIALIITAAFVVIEAAAGIFANSLALLTDAAHNFTDVIALGLSWYALRLTSQPANSSKTYGYHRAGILVALVNSTTLVLIALGIFYEAYRRLLEPPEVKPDVLIGVGLAAIAVNLVTAMLVRRGSQDDLNLRSASVHLMGDVYSSGGAVLAGFLIIFTQAYWIDPLISILMGLIILYNAWGIVRETVDILLESTPQDLDIQSLVDDIKNISGVLGVHDLHVWSLTRSLRTMSAHILTNDVPISAGAQIQEQINDLVYHRYRVGHATLQLECVDCEPDELYCDINTDKEPLLQ